MTAARDVGSSDRARDWQICLPEEVMPELRSRCSALSIRGARSFRASWSKRSSVRSHFRAKFWAALPLRSPEPPLARRHPACCAALLPKTLTFDRVCCHPCPLRTSTVRSDSPVQSGTALTGDLARCPWNRKHGYDGQFSLAHARVDDRSVRWTLKHITNRPCVRSTYVDGVMPGPKLVAKPAEIILAG